ncbi:hypothetical protein D1007_26892 [Hordeum vulgare]|nr:hypothetical protein D1007_26892 [Hordeum vulgare]
MRALGRDVASDTQALPRGNHAIQPALPGATMGEAHGRVPNIHSGLPPSGIRRELLEARNLAALGRRRPAFPGMLHGMRREYGRPDYINHWKRGQFDDRRVRTCPGYGGSSAHHHSGKRHARDPRGQPPREHV